MAVACPESVIQVSPEALAGWYAVQVRGRSEKLVSTLLSEKGFPVCLPVYKERRRWSDRQKDVELPVFPGYVFCSLNPRLRLPVMVTPGVISIVGCGSTPIPVDPAEMADLLLMAASGQALKPWPFVQCGSWVEIRRGPLAGTRGIVCAEKKTLRLIVSITLLQRSVMVEVEREHVFPTAANSTGNRVSANEAVM